jgi:hypothetical protein
VRVLKSAIIVHNGTQEKAHVFAAQILEFFGVPWSAIQVDQVASGACPLDNVAIIGRIDALADVLASIRVQGGQLPAVLFACASESLADSEEALRRIYGGSKVALRNCGAGEHRIRVSREMADIAGPMAGLEFTARVGEGAWALNGSSLDGPQANAIVTMDGSPQFVKLALDDTSVFFSGSAKIVNIDEPVRSGYYDVKNHFLEAAPLVMFVKSVFREVAWREQELGACLIVDDPLLKPRYGRCDFRVLRDSMQQHGFTTNISFIPWNWRRTSRGAARFFKNTGSFSVSIHGCDHTRSEFGDTSPVGLQGKARLAIRRMEDHEARTGIHHDRVMIFPQGVFSSACPEILKMSGYAAAVNTETVPVDSNGDGTRIRDVWDVAITRYGDFPIFTRRYAHHGIENFAFDLLLGKPCLIVSHHQFFRDNCNAVVELIKKLNALNCILQWRSLGEVIRRACRMRWPETSSLDIRMFGAELSIQNPASIGIDVTIRKRECKTDRIAEVRCNSAATRSDCVDGEIIVHQRLESRGELRVEVQYKDSVAAEKVSRPLSFEVSVAMRRILSELRDEYLARLSQDDLERTIDGSELVLD